MKQDACQDVFGVYGIWYQPWWHGWIYIMLSLCVFILVGILIWYRKKRFRLRPDQQALGQLHRLRSSTYASQESLHAAYFKLTTILKTYLSDEFAVQLHDKSDTQIVTLLHGIVSQNVLILLQEFFDRSLRIKFAYDVVSEAMLYEDIEILQVLIAQMHAAADTSGKR